MELLVPLVLFGLLWALLILPQQRRMRATQEMQNALQPGDDVLTTAGIYGRITEVEADSMFLEVAPGIELRVTRGAVARRLPPDEVPDGHDVPADGQDAAVDRQDPVDGAVDDVEVPAEPADGPGGTGATRRDDA